ncbi:MAG TPA: DUF3352 domain-containing protein [Bacteroidia bacterium]|nr:DUF3352 domain-containing protein [Bacteroidia bacterium]
MSKRARILLIIAAVLVVGAGVYGYLRIRKLELPVRDALEAVPDNAFCVIGSDDVRGTWAKFSQGNLVWDALTETEWASSVSHTIGKIDSLLNTDQDVKSFFENRQCWLSLHFTGNEGFDYLITTSLPSTGDEDDFSAFISKKCISTAKVGESKWKGFPVYEIEPFSNPKFFIGMREGVILISGNEELLKTGMDQLEKGPTLKNNKSFSAVQQTAGEKAAANVYFNYTKLLVGLKRLSTDNYHDRLESINRFAEWTEMDLSLRPNAVLMNGYTSSPDSAKEFLGVFKGQQPQRIEAATVLPGSTITYSCLGISNFQLYDQRYDTYLDHEGAADERRDKLAQLKRNYNFDPDKQIGNWLGNEIVTAIIPAPEGGTTTIALLSAANTGEAKSTLQSLEIKTDSVTSDVISDSSGFVIRKLPVPEMLSATFGGLFSDLREAYYTVIQQYVVVAPDENTLRSIIASNQNGTTLAHNRAYADFATNMSQEASLTLYISPGHCESLLSDHASSALAENLKLHPGLLRRFDGAVLQYSTGDNDLFYTNIFLRHNPQTKKDIASLWETQLDTTFSGKPWLVMDHRTKGLDIFIQDDANKVYLISPTGTIIWKKQLPEKIIGDVKQVDALKNGKYQLVFNTTSYIYIIDRGNNDLPPFPIRLPAPATNSVSVIDYDNTRDYRLLIACSDKRIYNYMITGKKVDGWKLPMTQDIVSVPVQRVLVGDKDYVIIADRSGKIYITDRQGNPRLALKEQLNSPVTQIVVEPGKDLSRTRIVSADSTGNVSRLSLTDDLERMHFMDFENAPGFDYCDIDGDGNREFIFLDAHRLMLFNQDKAPVMSFTFDSPPDPHPQIFFFDTKDVRVGVLCPTNSELHLINNGGADAEGFPIQGSTAFSIGKLNGDGVLTLICGNNKKYLCAYPLR